MIKTKTEFSSVLEDTKMEFPLFEGETKMDSKKLSLPLFNQELRPNLNIPYIYNNKLDS